MKFSQYFNKVVGIQNIITNNGIYCNSNISKKINKKDEKNINI